MILKLHSFAQAKRWPFRFLDENFTKVPKHDTYTPEAFLFSFIKPQ